MVLTFMVDLCFAIVWSPREKSIFECMIANLFEEYKFFNRYPDKQLKLAAILFGKAYFTWITTLVWISMLLLIRASIFSLYFFFMWSIIIEICKLQDCLLGTNLWLIWLLVLPYELFWMHCVNPQIPKLVLNFGDDVHFTWRHLL